MRVRIRTSRSSPPEDRNPDGTPTNSNPTVTIADFGAAPIGVPNFVIDQFTIPPFLLPIYQACGTQYGVPWEVLASINRIETAFGTNLNVSSAGALGWMQFIPSSWEAYGVDANNDGRKDPYNPVDAICAAANYLEAAGGQEDLSTRDLRLQPRRLVRRRGPPLRPPVRQDPRRPRRLAHRPDRRRALPRRREVPLRGRHLRARGARARDAEEGLSRQRRRRHLELAHPARDQHLQPRGRPRRRRERRRHQADGQVGAAGPLHRAGGRLRQPLHLRRARRGGGGLPGAEAAQEPDARPLRRVRGEAGRARLGRQAGQRPDDESKPKADGSEDSPGPPTPRIHARASTPSPSARPTRTRRASPASSTIS